MSGDDAETTGELDVSIAGVAGASLTSLTAAVTIAPRGGDADELTSLVVELAHVDPIAWRALGEHREWIVGLIADGDGGPATAAHLNMPSDVALAPNGDIYIADMHHQRVRRVDARTRIITTVAGNGRWGNTGDGGPATAATLAGPAGITVVADAAGKLLAQTISVKTFVVGFSDAVIGSLKGIAEAGGTADAFNANNPASLEDRKSVV